MYVCKELAREPVGWGARHREHRVAAVMWSAEWEKEEEPELPIRVACRVPAAGAVQTA